MARQIINPYLKEAENVNYGDHFSFDCDLLSHFLALPSGRNLGYGKILLTVHDAQFPWKTDFSENIRHLFVFRSSWDKDKLLKMESKESHNFQVSAIMRILGL